MQLAWATLAVLPALVEDGRTRPLALLLRRRTTEMPDVPTIAETGQPWVDIHPWGGFVAHAGTPPELSASIGRELRKVVATPELVAAIDKLGMVALGSRAAEFAELLKTQPGSFGNGHQAGRPAGRGVSRLKTPSASRGAIRSGARAPSVRGRARRPCTCCGSPPR